MDGQTFIDGISVSEQDFLRLVKSLENGRGCVDGNFELAVFTQRFLLHCAIELCHERSENNRLDDVFRHVETPRLFIPLLEIQIRPTIEIYPKAQKWKPRYGSFQLQPVGETPRHPTGRAPRANKEIESNDEIKLECLASVDFKISTLSP